jgi:hypothetical protein
MRLTMPFIGMMTVFARAEINNRPALGGECLVDRLFNGLTGLAGALLNATK